MVQRSLIYICKNSQLKQKIILEFHTSPLGGHFGILKNYHKVKKVFFWDGLKSDIQNFVVEHLVCQKKKIDATQIYMISVETRKLPCSNGDKFLLQWSKLPYFSITIATTPL